MRAEREPDWDHLGSGDDCITIFAGYEHVLKAAYYGGDTGIVDRLRGMDMGTAQNVMRDMDNRYNAALTRDFHSQQETARQQREAQARSSYLNESPAETSRRITDDTYRMLGEGAQARRNLDSDILRQINSRTPQDYRHTDYSSQRATSVPSTGNGGRIRELTQQLLDLNASRGQRVAPQQQEARHEADIPRRHDEATSPALQPNRDVRSGRIHSGSGGGPTRSVGHVVDRGDIKTARNQAGRGESAAGTVFDRNSVNSRRR